LTLAAEAYKIESVMEAILTVIFVLVGMILASFLNVCIDRLPVNESLLFPASHCASCQRRLALKDLIPVFSYLWLRGRCRYCQAAIPKRILWVEIGTGALFGYLYWHYGLSTELAATAFYGCLLIVLMVIDLEHGLILNKIVYPATAIALLISAFLAPSKVTLLSGEAASLANTYLPQPGILQAVIGGGIGLVLLFLIVVISRGGMGWGDVKLAALIGIVTGYLIPVALLLAAILGGIVATILLLSKIKKGKEAIPFAPFLSVATIITLLWGSNILNWYLGLF
jgi:leader peptidase (prepilin peptidase)/N-methyltransferase